MGRSGWVEGDPRKERGSLPYPGEGSVHPRVCVRLDHVDRSKEISWEVWSPDRVSVKGDGNTLNTL